MAPVSVGGMEPMAALHALERWLRDELDPLPQGVPERLVAFRHIFSEIIAQLPAHGPLLAEIKREYETVLQAATTGREAAHNVAPQASQLVGSLPHRPLHTLHPLQMPAAYYEAQWRRCQDELALAKSQRQRLRRIVRKLRAVSVEGIHRLYAAGSSDAGAASEASKATRAALEELDELEDEPDESATAGVADPDTALAAARAVVSAQTEDAVDLEVNKLREQLMVTDVRVGSAARFSSRAAHGARAAVALLDEEVTRAAADAELYPPGGDESSAEPARRVESLRGLLRTLRQQEEDLSSLVKLLAESKSLDGATLRKLAQSSTEAH